MGVVVITGDVVIVVSSSVMGVSLRVAAWSDDCRISD